jgi:hypothetical protein
MKIQRSEPLPLYAEIKALIETSRSTVVRMVNTTMVYTYFQIGRSIVEHEQKGLKRAVYATETLKKLSEKLVNEFGKGFSERNLENMRNFYLIYSDKISQTLSAKSCGNQKSETTSRISSTTFQLSWSHYVFLIRLPEKERTFYEIEAVKQNWSSNGFLMNSFEFVDAQTVS